MRPYQIAATERILWKIKSSYLAKTWSDTQSGGYIWHTTGSGKTLTSFKAARLATELDFIDKVFFVVDRKDLDYQTMKEYQRFSPDSVNGSNSTQGLRQNIEKDDNRIIVTTIQKLNNLIRAENDLAIYQKQVVFIFDEAHRSQFGEAQKNIQKKFKKYYQFGFTGTPIFTQNALGSETTQSVFGTELHAYVITDAIRDEKVLKFKVDYNDLRPHFKQIEMEQDEEKLSSAALKQAFLHPERIKEVTQYILKHFRHKTHRLKPGSKGFNAMFAVSSVDAAKAYYESFKRLQQEQMAISPNTKPLNVATIFSYAANEEQDAIGDITDESLETSAMNSTAREFLDGVIKDYNAHFNANFSTEGEGFQQYYRDLAKRVKSQEVDLLIVVGMFLTGFDAPTLNTLFVDKNLKYHGLIQAFSRTNRIYDATKSFGNIVTFRNLEQETIDAIKLFGDKNTKNVILEKSFDEYMNGFTDILSGKARRGFIEIVAELNARFPNPQEIETEADKKAFVKLFGEYLRVENLLQNFDEFTALSELQAIDINNAEALEAFKIEHHLTDEMLTELKGIKLPTERELQDYRSVYNDTRDWLRAPEEGKESPTLDWNDVVFEVEILNSLEINLDYILTLIFKEKQSQKTKADLIEEVRRVIRSSLDNRAKESLLIDFINQTHLESISDSASIIDAFFTFAKAELRREVEQLIQTENLNDTAARRYINSSLKREHASESGTELNDALPKMSLLNPEYKTKKQTVYQKVSELVEKYKGIGSGV
ncbi:type I restriction enzyme, R subunit [Thorsellia anophelis DSM 18579]|uniref:Type I restriction enzyme endonuclease subunit n=1 Tax=Thorsellia anophelis DSM 18579 TaxID=1123402 RepID=A0A1I0FVV4_9GAMM|nr:type I restriction enzyme, R subunit [Thorsellia anophelis DSM 18579]